MLSGAFRSSISRPNSSTHFKPWSLASNPNVSRTPNLNECHELTKVSCSMPASIHREISICSAQLTIGLQTRLKVPKRSVPVTAATGSSSDGFTQIPPVKVMRRILESPGVHQGPACFDALSAKLVEQAGFQFCFMSGFSVSAARLALPDVGLISYGEMIDQGSQITSAVSIPVIGDGDTGYGNILNVKRTVKGYIRAGFAGILLEDQVSPKACGHTQGRKVVSREEAVLRIKAAVDARKESSSDIVIVARTDARQAVSLEESLWRIQAFADAKADVLFIDALTSREEMKAFCNIAPHVPKMVPCLHQRIWEEKLVRLNNIQGARSSSR